MALFELDNSTLAGLLTGLGALLVGIAAVWRAKKNGRSKKEDDE